MLRRLLADSNQLMLSFPHGDDFRENVTLWELAVKGGIRGSRSIQRLPSQPQPRQSPGDTGKDADKWDIQNRILADVSDAQGHILFRILTLLANAIQDGSTLNEVSSGLNRILTEGQPEPLPPTPRDSEPPTPKSAELPPMGL